MSTDYPDWSVPQTSANAIAATGVPLLSAKNVLGSNTTVIGPGANQNIGPFAITQPSYEIQMTAYESGAGATGPLLLKFNWNDSVSVATVAVEYYWIWPGVALNDHIIYGRGPTKADQLLIQAFNQSGAMQYSLFWRVLQSSRLFQRDDLRTVFYATTASGGTIPTLEPPSSLLGYRSVSVAAAASDNTELPLYVGMAQLYADTGSNTTDFTLTIQDSANPDAEGLGSRMLRYKSDANGLIVAQLALPRYQCRVSMLNGNAAAKFLTYSLHSID